MSIFHFICEVIGNFAVPGLRVIRSRVPAQQKRPLRRCIFTYFWYSQLFRLSDEELASLGMTEESIRRLRCVVDKRPTTDELPLPLPLPIPSIEKGGQITEPVEVSNLSFCTRSFGLFLRFLPLFSLPPSTLVDPIIFGSVQRVIQRISFFANSK